MLLNVRPLTIDYSRIYLGSLWKNRLLGHAGHNKSQNVWDWSWGPVCFPRTMNADTLYSLKSIAHMLKFRASIPSQPAESSELCQYSDNKAWLEFWFYHLLAIRLWSVVRHETMCNRTWQNVGLKGVFDKWFLLLILLLLINMFQLVMHPHSVPSSNWLILRILFLLTQPFHSFSKLQPASFPSNNRLLECDSCLSAWHLNPNPPLPRPTLPHSTSFSN